MFIIRYILLGYLVVLLLTAMLSWFPLTYGSAAHRAKKALDALSEPLLRPLRRRIRPIDFGGVGLDVSFMILFFGVLILTMIFA